MIGRLKGILLEKKPPCLLLDVGGVAYELDAPMFTFYRLADIGQEVILHTHLVVREDAQLLYGFSQERERALFRSLIKVSSIGPKLALAILSGIEPDAFVNCIMHNDAESLIRIPGIGKKTAERLIIEMRDRLQDWKPDNLEHMHLDIQHSTDKATQDAISALVSLGYKPNEARQAVSQTADEHQTSEEIIRHALRSMLRSKTA
jgi:holliday junction DNA helicase RuvA